MSGKFESINEKSFIANRSKGLRRRMVPRVRFELTALSLEVSCSIQLSYRGAVTIIYQVAQNLITDIRLVLTTYAC